MEEQLTYDDWLNNRIIPEFWEEGNKPHSLHYALATAFPKRLSQEAWEAIMQSQRETWEEALNMNLNVWIKYIDDHLKYELVSDKDQFLDLERKIIQKEIDSNLKAYQDVLKDYRLEINNITGADFNQIKSYNKYPPQQEIKLNIPEEDWLNFTMHLAKRKLEYLDGLKQKDWKELYKDLHDGHYIADCSLSDFNYVMNEHSLPKGRETDRIKWIGDRIVGYWFGKYAGFDLIGVKTLNKLFIPKNGKPFRASDRGKKDTPLKGAKENLLLKHFPPIQ